ncbi:hypothetical protein BG011_004284 [Mortierella polycephala]|uniref:Uncharacterized protein n=1 Tax=Mortierella polycephala TaxID=41804 RepID=A0A9P6PYP5_9FUNG|nr:hypothetical protein BG011_004284 [Mortierella polycephala]
MFYILCYLYISAEAIRSMGLRKRRKINKLQSAALDQNQFDVSELNTSNAGAADNLQQQNEHLQMDQATAPATINAVQAIEAEVTTELNQAISSLRSKLEILQPSGMRPSDIAAAISSVTEADANGSGGHESTHGENEMVLSQTATSQRSILLWDDIRVLVDMGTSHGEKVRSIVNDAVADLGLDNLEDGVLSQLCVNEAFVQEEEQEGVEAGIESNALANSDEAAPALSTKATQLSYQSSLFLCVLLFYNKARKLKSTPSRLFLDSIVHAARAYGRAVVDGVLMPLFRDSANFSKQSSELIQKVLKEQTSAIVVHFISMAFDAKDSVVSNMPVLFTTELHLTTVQGVLSFANVPSPLPSRLWTRLNDILEALWRQVLAGTMSESSSFAGSFDGTKEAWAVILQLYQPSGFGESCTETNAKVIQVDQEQFRLANQKLVQLLKTWTTRQGPWCQDVENLQQLRQFCATRLEAKEVKAVVSRLDMFIRKRNTN